jgi:hypothetical protein
MDDQLAAHNQRTWVTLPPTLLMSLESLAAQEPQSLEVLVVHLIAEATAHRLSRRN